MKKTMDSRTFKDNVLMELFLNFDFRAYRETRRGLVERHLAEMWLDSQRLPSSPVFCAMRHSLMAGGKRLRPILVIAGAEACGGNINELTLSFACAIEMIHTYSLIHDDLPAMDNDDLRRGMPTCHKEFGEAMAILAGDGLLTYAFEYVTSPAILQEQSPSALANILAAICLLSNAAGVYGMVGGQAADILFENKDTDKATLDFIHLNKTTRLISASVEIGAMLAGASEAKRIALKNYGTALGLAFQIKDDILDEEGDPAVMGKPKGSDKRLEKTTYPKLYGMEASKARLNELVEGAISYLDIFDHTAEPLRAIASYVMTRNK